MLRLLVVWAAVAAQPVTVLPQPHFHAPATGAGSGNIHFEIVSSTAADPARDLRSPSSRPLRLEGPDGATRHVVVAPGRYAFDFRKYARPPRIAPGEREFVYEETVFASARKTGKVLVVHEATYTGGFGAELVARIADQCFEDLDGPVRRVAYADRASPYNKLLEQSLLPDRKKVADALRALARY